MDDQWHFLAVGVILTVAIGVTRVEGAVPAAYYLGDSLLDIGNNNYLVASIFKANFRWHGIDFRGGNNPAGRFCNGRNAADFIAEKIGLSESPPFLSVEPNNTDIYFQGLNFASVGAGVLPIHRVLPFEQYILLDKQIQYFSEVVVALEQKFGRAATQDHLSQSLFVVSVGSNDFFRYYRYEDHSTPQKQVNSMLSAFSGQLMRIYDLGARKLIVIGLAPIGCAPGQRRQNEGECNNELNYWAIKYNEGVTTLLKEMKDVHSDMDYSFFNVSAVLNDFIVRPSHHGFTDVKTACCGLGYLNAGIPCNPLAFLCGNRSSHLFWDRYHPTEMTAKLMIDVLFDGSAPTVLPINARQLCELSADASYM